MDNFYKSCPPMMDDGRFLCDFRSGTVRNEYNKYINNINDDNNYRLFLQRNASKIMENQWFKLKKNNSCWKNECVHNYPNMVYPPWFVDERNNYNNLQNPNRKINFPCKHFSDYRLTK